MADIAVSANQILEFTFNRLLLNTIAKIRLILAMSSHVSLRHFLLAGLLTGVLVSWTSNAEEIYYEPGINPYREQIAQDGIESVDPYSGMLKVQHLDLFLPGNGGLDIKVLRTYDSADVVQLGVGASLTSPLGNGWTFHFGLFSGYNVCNPTSQMGTIRPTFKLPDGTQFRFLKAQTGFGHLYVSREGWVADCASDGKGLLVISPEGMRYELTVQGVLGLVVGENTYYVKKITDKNGNWLNFDYQVTAHKAYILKITANDGRVVDFSYEPGITVGTRLSKMTANGKSWLYSYALSGSSIDSALNVSNFELAKVTRPDGRQWRYEYPTFPSNSPFVTARGYMGQIIYPEGGFSKYSYTYISLGLPGLAAKMLKLTQKVSYDNINPAATWTYRYKFWESVNGSSTGISTTDVEDPAGGLTTYKHEAPFSAFSTAKAWRVGLLLEKMKCSSKSMGFPVQDILTCTPSTAISREQNEWGSQLLPSPDPYQASTGFETYTDMQASRPLLTKKTVTRDGTIYSTQYLSHDTYGNPAKIIETGNGVTRTTDLTYYNDPVKWIVGQPDKQTIDSTWITDRNFDANGNVLSVIKYGVATNFTYYQTGDIASTTNAKGDRTDFSDYYRGVPRREDQPGGVTIYRTVNPTGTLASETNGEADTTQYAYDGLNRLMGVTPAIGNPTAIQWVTNGMTCIEYSGLGCEFVSVIDKRVTRGSFEEATKFDGFGRPTDVTKLDIVSQAKVRKAYQYDALGRKVAESYPTTSTSAISTLPRITYTYDNLDRIVKLAHADNKTRQLQYLANNQIKITNENNKATTYAYRSFGDPDQRELMSVTAPVAAANMTLTRNVLGQVTSMTQSGVTRTQQYDTRGFLVKINHPEIGWVTYGCDAVGNPISKSVGVAPSARTIIFGYDNRNRLTSTTYPDASTPAITLDYNKVDDIVSATRGGVARAYGYDANRNLISESLTVDARTFSLGYVYDGNDAVTQVTYPNSDSVNYYPDALGRPAVVSPYVTSIAYHPTGQVSGMTYANGVTMGQAFNTRLWPSQMAVTKSALNLINTGYLYDGLGNVTSMTDGVDASYNRTLGYDDIDRLTSVTGPWGAGSITYDGRGNLLSQNYGPTYSRTYTYDTANRLASYTGSTAFTYDAWGNATRSGNALSYHLYDDASNLYCASCDSASPLQFEYDANNYRVKKTRNGVATYSLYAKDGNLMMEYTPSAGDLKQFAYHNKKQVAMRHLIDPAMVLGQNGMLNPSPFAAAVIPFKSGEIETGVLSGLIPSTPLLSLALVASAD